MTQISNITNPGAEPTDGDILQYTYENGIVVEKQFWTPVVSEDASSARAWRDRELLNTDDLVVLPTLTWPETTNNITLSCHASSNPVIAFVQPHPVVTHATP